MIREKAGKLKYSDYFKKKRSRETRKRIVTAIAAVVVFVTTYSLILPAITLDVSRAGREPGVAFEQMQFRATASAASVTAADSTAEEVRVEEDSAEEPTEEETVEEDIIGNSEGKSSAASDNQEQKEAAALSEREEAQETPAESDPEEEPAAETRETEEIRGDEGSGSKTDAASSSMSESSHAQTADPQKETDRSAADQAAVDRSDAGMTDDASAASEETSPEFQIPTLDAIDFDDILTGETAFYYYHPENTDEAESLSSDSIDDWKKAGSDTVLAPQDFLRVYLSYEIPAGALNETNAEVRYRLPDVLQLSDRQIQTINGYENGIAASKSGSEHDKYLGAEAIEGSRTPDEKAGDEYISATVKVEKTNDDRQELVFTFIPYTIEKNQISYDATGKLTSEGRNVKGFFTFDLTTSQIDFENTEKETVEKEDGTTEEIQYSEADVVFVKENNDKNIDEISSTLTMAVPVEKDEPQEQEQKTLISKGANNDYTVTVSYTDDAQIPDNAELAVREIEKDTDEYASYLEQAKGAVDESKSVNEARFFDITIVADGEKIEPQAPVNVQITFTGIEQTNSDDTQLLHYKDDKEVEVMDQAEFSKSEEPENETKAVDTVQFETDGFSVYGIVGTETIVVDYLTANGETYTITVLFDEREMLTGNMNLYVTEIPAGSEAYDGYLTDAKTAMGLCELDEFREARFFDIEITKNGEKYEPAYPATITIQCMDSVKKNKTDTLKVVHFAESGTEVISEVAISKNGTELTYEQSSFSVTGVVVSGGSSFPPDGYYILVLHSGNNYYAVGKDGSLQSVDYNENGTVTFESFTNMSQVDDYYWRQSTSASNTNRRFYINGNSYIDPFSSSGVSRIARLVGLDGNRLFASLPSGTYYLGVSNGQLVGYANANNAASVLFAHEFSSTHTAVFKGNGGTGTTPPHQTVEGGEIITFPENPFTRPGFVFIGWSEDNDANGSDVKHHWSAVYQPGDTFILNEDKTFYAVWSRENQTSSFYIRLDGKIPQEPASGEDYPAAEYTKGVTIANVLKLGKFYANTAGVDSNLNSMPTADQLVAMINDSSNKLGFKVQNSGGKVVVSQITDAAKNSSNYNVSTGDELYVLWYVTKCAYPGPVLPNYNTNWWHVDGVLLVRKRVNLIYSANAPAGSFSNMPLGSQWPVGSDVIVGNDGGDNESIKQPVRNDGYNFVGWKMYTKDNAGEYTVYKGTYATHDHFTITEDTLLVAQWEKDKTSIFIIKKDQNDSTQLLHGAQFRLTGFSETDDRAVESGTNENGRVSFDPIEFDTLYKLEEIAAPTGYTALDSPVFFKETKVGTRMVITFYTDETGTQITDPDNRVSVSVTGTGLEINIGNVRELGKAEFLKTGESTDVKLEGAEFQLFTDITCSTPTSYTSETGADGKVSFNDIPTDTYYMKEIKAPAGYQLSNDIYQVVINKDDFTIKKVVEGSPTGDSLSTISNVHLPVEIKVYKVDESDRRALEGAAFKLTRSEDGNSAYTEYPDSDNCTFITDENGKFSVTLPKGYYRLSEIAPPPGYVITTGGFDFSVSDGNVTFADLSDITFSAENKTFTVANKPGAGLPNTGGPGTYFHTLSGFTLIFTSALMYVFRMRRKERRTN